MDDTRLPELDELLGWGLVCLDGGRPVALEPLAAVRRRTRQQLDEIAAQVQEVAAQDAAADELAVHFARGQWQSGPGSRFLGEPETVNARLQDVVGQARTEILAAQPGGPRSRELMGIAVKRDTAALQRGVRLRTLYRDSVRDDVLTREWASTMSAHGADYRTLVSPFQRIIIVDRREAFISDYVQADAAPHAAWHVTDRPVVGFMAAVFDDIWNRASPWHGQPRTAERGLYTAGRGGGVRTTRLQREILRDMAAGIEQRRTADRLGIGLRTLTRHIKELREMWRAASLPQLAAMWMVSPDRLVDDYAPAGEPAGAEHHGEETAA